jgi:hypothetical protein
LHFTSNLQLRYFNNIQLVNESSPEWAKTIKIPITTKKHALMNPLLLDVPIEVRGMEEGIISSFIPS